MLPIDPNMLLSYVNTKLRDEFSSIEELCDCLDVDREELVNKLQNAGYRYDHAINQFV